MGAFKYILVLALASTLHLAQSRCTCGNVVLVEQKDPKHGQFRDVATFFNIRDDSDRDVEHEEQALNLPFGGKDNCASRLSLGRLIPDYKLAEENKQSCDNVMFTLPYTYTKAINRYVPGILMSQKCLRAEVAQGGVADIAAVEGRGLPTHKEVVHKVEDIRLTVTTYGCEYVE